VSSEPAQLLIEANMEFMAIFMGGSDTW
jgi:hypothetical protein